MKTAVTGSGGREAAIVWKLNSEGHEAYALPGNAACPSLEFPFQPGEIDKLVRLCRDNAIEILIPGTEAPLADDLVTKLPAAGGPPVIGPDAKAARLESSKAFAKDFMQRYGVATARSQKVFGSRQALEVINKRFGESVVIKYDGLAAGKGVWVCHNHSQINDALSQIEENYPSDACLLLEELLIGDELSLIGFTDGKCIKLLLPAQDHKQAFDQDQGPNTGGMGAFCPVTWCDDELLDEIRQKIVFPTLNGIQKEAFHYRGPLYFGVMVTADGPKLLEYNVRFGDPEAQVLLPMLKSSLSELYLACHQQQLAQFELQFHSGFCVGVVLASESYPKSPAERINLSQALKINSENHHNPLLFISSASIDNGKNPTGSGRILTAVARADSLESARKISYELIAKLHMPQTRYRSDIGCRTQKIIRSRS